MEYLVYVIGDSDKTAVVHSESCQKAPALGPSVKDFGPWDDLVEAQKQAAATGYNLAPECECVK